MQSRVLIPRKIVVQAINETAVCKKQRLYIENHVFHPNFALRNRHSGLLGKICKLVFFSLTSDKVNYFA
jgi:hypothetical protein